MSLSNRPQNKPENNPFFAICKEAIQAKSERLKNEYYSSPKHCLREDCKKVIPYEKKENNFCSRTCSATHNNKTRVLSDQAKQNISEAARKALSKTMTTLNRNTESYPFSKVSFSTCKGCYKCFRVKTKYMTYYCSHECKNSNVLESKMRYRTACLFKLNKKDHPELFDGDLIKKYGWYSAANRGNNLTGVTWDHLYRVSEGYANKKPAEILAHPANAELIPFSVNVKRQKSSQITYEELLERISRWDSGDRNLPRFYSE